MHTSRFLELVFYGCDFTSGSSYGVGIGIGEIVSEVHREMYGVGFGDVGVDGPYYCFP